MKSNGNHLSHRGIKWTPEMRKWITERCPLIEHGYASRKQLLDELNAVFGTSFTERALVTHCYESGVKFGMRPGVNVARGELATMAHLGHTVNMTVEERKICLLRARIAIEKTKLVGADKAMKIHRKIVYARKKYAGIQTAENRVQ